MIKIYTDGSSIGNPGPGGWGCIAFYNGKVFEFGGGSDGKDTTNNRMEVSAVLDAMDFCVENKIKNEDIELISDSKGQCVNAINEWMYNWIQKGWKKAGGLPVKNTDLYKEIYNRKEELEDGGNRVKCFYVKAHAGIYENERADTIAKAFAVQENIDLAEGVSEGEYRQ